MSTAHNTAKLPQLKEFDLFADTKDPVTKVTKLIAAQALHRNSLTPFVPVRRHIVLIAPCLKYRVHRLACVCKRRSHVKAKGR